MQSKKSQDLVRQGTELPYKGHRAFFVESFENPEFHSTKHALVSRLQGLLNDPIFANTIAGGHSTIDLEKAMNR